MQEKNLSSVANILVAAVIALVTTGQTSAALAKALPGGDRRAQSDSLLDQRLAEVLAVAGYTGRIESTLKARLGRPIDPALADLGRLLFFDKILSLHNDNSCAGCHSPAFGFGDSQPMAIGVDNNGVVGPNRVGPRNQRRSPLVANTIFYPALMWTPRFVALSGDPFDPSLGFKFPPPENIVYGEPTLLAAQGSLPSTELVEMAGFTGISANPGPFGPRHFQFDDSHGQVLPAPDETGFHNFPIQAAVDKRLDFIPEYLEKFGQAFNEGGVTLPPGGITISMRRRAIAEFQSGLLAANAPLDRFARGNRAAMTRSQKRGALLFFGKAGCVHCHAVAGPSNEMFSDFKPHRIGGPQLGTVFGVGTGNLIFDGLGENEDFGFEQTEGDPALRYTFRTAPLRNLKVAPAFFHNGAFGTLEAAIAHHLDIKNSLRNYDRRENSVTADHEGPFEGILDAGIDPLLERPIKLSRREFLDLVEFVRDGLFDERVLKFCEHLPASVPSGLPLQIFRGCE
jgi:cytochrome c peroxidase